MKKPYISHIERLCSPSAMLDYRQQVLCREVGKALHIEQLLNYLNRKLPKTKWVTGQYVSNKPKWCYYRFVEGWRLDISIWRIKLILKK